MITTEVYVKLLKEISASLGIFLLRPELMTRWAPGMFLQLSHTTRNASEPWLDSRPFNIASWGGKKLRIIMRKEGTFTKSLFEMGKKGFYTSVKYPLGNFYLMPGEPKIFLTGGAGISAFTGYLDYVLKNQVDEDIAVFHSVRDYRECVSEFYWDSIPENVAIYTHLTRNKDSGARIERLTFEDMARAVPDYNNFAFYISGPRGFANYWIEQLGTRGISAKVEKWTSLYG